MLLLLLLSLMSSNVITLMFLNSFGRRNLFATFAVVVVVVVIQTLNNNVNSNRFGQTHRPHRELQNKCKVNKGSVSLCCLLSAPINHCCLEFGPPLPPPPPPPPLLEPQIQFNWPLIAMRFCKLTRFWVCVRKQVRSCRVGGAGPLV